MKLVTCFLAPSRLEAVKRALWEGGWRAFSVSPAEGLGQRRLGPDLERGDDDFVAALVPRARLELACRDEEAAPVIGAILSQARTGRVGDGKIFVTELTEVVRVRTGERGPAAL